MIGLVWGVFSIPPGSKMGHLIGGFVDQEDAVLYQRHCEDENRRAGLPGYVYFVAYLAPLPVPPHP